MNIFKRSKPETALPLIINMMADYLSIEERKADSPFMSIGDIQNKFNRLVSLGLKNSQNAKELEVIIRNQETYNNNILKAQKLIDYIKKVNTVLDKNSYLISFEQFEVVCKKYNLVYNLLENYTGVIPEENIFQLEKIAHKISEESVKSHEFHPLSINSHIFYIKEVEISSETSETNGFIKWVKNKKILYLPNIDIFYSRLNSRDIQTNYPDCPTVSTSNCVKATCLGCTQFLIAAPKTHFKDNFKIEIRPKDPIVFQICPYGILIHSVWGEEADDEVLAKYRKTLNL
jgi:hypothetical protein